MAILADVPACVPWIGFTIVFFLSFLPARADARAVVSELLWAGSELSAADEWIEIAGLDEPTDLGGWTVTSVATSGVETVVATFAEGSVLEPGRALVVARYSASESRLKDEPAIVTSHMTLPNTKLLVRLRDGAGTVMDEVDDGSGAPFAGSNVSGAKAGMERIDLRAAGTASGNWKTADIRDGFDDGAAVLGTPGTLWQSVEPLQEPRSSASAPPAASEVAHSSLSSPCPDARIVIQSGTTAGEEKVTINVQVLAGDKEPPAGRCRVEFGDDESSDSCNPSPHTYDAVGDYVLRAVIANHCGTTVERYLRITVVPKRSSSATKSSSSATSLSYARWNSDSFFLAAAMPDTAGADAGNEWIEIANGRGQAADLLAWTIRMPRSGRSFTFGSIGFAPGETKRFPAGALGLVLPNAGGEMELLNPSGTRAGTLRWESAVEAKAVLAPLPSLERLTGTVLSVLDGDTFDLRVSETELLPGIRPVERVRLIGIDAPELYGGDYGESVSAKRSLNYLRDLVEGQRVELEFDTSKRDVHGRLLGYARTPDGYLLQHLLLSRGHARLETRFPFARLEEFRLALAEAQETSEGIWDFPESSSSARSGRAAIVRRPFFLPLRMIATSSSSRLASQKARPVRAVKRVEKRESVVQEGGMTPFAPDAAFLREESLAPEPPRKGHALPLLALGGAVAFVGFGCSIFLFGKG